MRPLTTRRGLFAVVVIVGAVTAASPASSPRDGVSERRLAVRWERAIDDAECLLGQVTHAARGSDGTLYVVDQKVGEVKVFDREGRFMRTLSHLGEGPGETETPSEVVLPGDGRIGILQRAPARLVWLDLASGDPRGALNLKDEHGEPYDLVALLGVQPTAAGLVVALGKPNFDSQSGGGVTESQWIARLDERGAIAACFLRRDDCSTDREPCRWYRFGDRRWTAAPDGRVFVAPERDRHVVRSFAANGASLWTAERAYEAPRVDGASRERERARGANHGGFWRVEECDRPPVVRALRWSDRGEIWVQLDLGRGGQDGGVIAWYDVLAADTGAYLRQERWTGDFDYDLDRAFWLDDQNVLVVRIEDDGTQSLRWLAVDTAAPRGS